MKNNLIADKANSTYWWIIYLDRKNPFNKTDEMHGYSKFQNHDESKCKKNMIMAKIEMLYKNGYLKRCTHIEFYKKIAPLPNKQEDLLILTLYKNDFLIPEKMITNFPHEVKTFLSKFYDAITAGREIKNLRPLPEKTKSSKDDYFNLDKLFFSKISELQSYSKHLLDSGFPLGMIEGFQKKAMIKFFPNIQ